MTRLDETVDQQDVTEDFTGEEQAELEQFHQLELNARSLDLRMRRLAGRAKQFHTLAGEEAAKQHALRKRQRMTAKELCALLD